MTTEAPTQDDLQQLARREVHYCVSTLVATLANGYGALTRNDPADLRDLCERAAKLAAPVPDYEEAAIQEGWTVRQRDDGAWTFEKKSAPYDDSETWGWFAVEQDAWQKSCNQNNIEPYDREVYEHWIVSDWLACELEAHGEKVDRDFAGMTVWARTTTGQAIFMDSVIAEIWRELHNGG